MWPLPPETKNGFKDMKPNTRFFLAALLMFMASALCRRFWHSVRDSGRKRFDATNNPTEGWLGTNSVSV